MKITDETEERILELLEKFNVLNKDQLLHQLVSFIVGAEKRKGVKFTEKEIDSFVRRARYYFPEEDKE